ncbi:MAG: TIR domain-containing protein [Planctomycetaceae bacterium]
MHPKKIVFISYKQAEADELADEIFNYLNMRGHKVYLDKHCNHTAVPWLDNCFGFIEECDFFVALFSKPNGDKNAKEGILVKERRAAHQSNKVVIPVLASNDAQCDLISNQFQIVNMSHKENREDSLKLLARIIEEGTPRTSLDNAIIDCGHDPEASGEEQLFEFSDKPLKQGAFSYVTRICDADLANAASSHFGVYITGPSGLGKTSLQKQVGKMLPNDWCAVFLPTAIFRTDDPKLFLDGIFEKVTMAYEAPVRDFSQLAMVVERGKPCALLIDEIGVLDLNVLETLLPGIYEMHENQPERFRVVATISNDRRENATLEMTLRDRLAKARKDDRERTSVLISNEKYVKMWARVQVSEFSKDNALELIQRLPRRLIPYVSNHLDMAFNPRPARTLGQFGKMGSCATESF